MGSFNSLICTGLVRLLNGANIDGDVNISNSLTCGTRDTSKTVGLYSSAEGNNNEASGQYSHAEGSSCIASGLCSHAEGGISTATAKNSHAEGSSTATGSDSHAEGCVTKASGAYSHSEGYDTTADHRSSHAEGEKTTASGTYSHAENKSTTASGTSSHAEGSTTTASGVSSHAEGKDTTASGDYSHAEGNGSKATGSHSHAEGLFTTAQRKSQHVFGEYNVLDTTGANGTARGSYIEIVGKGTGGARSNARTLDWSGNEWIAGTYSNGSSRKLKTNIESLTDSEALKVLELNPVKFDFISAETDDQRERGFIAEEVMEVIPQVAFEEETDEEGNITKPASLNYIGLIPYLVKIIQIQQREIDELKNK